jgi:hypothetical protein
MLTAKRINASSSAAINATADQHAAAVAFMLRAATDALAALQAPDPDLDAERAVMAAAAAAR